MQDVQKIKKLLIITQKVDKNDPVLGFFHRWIEEFAKRVERVGVICLWEGEHGFAIHDQQPTTNDQKLKNVFVYSLGKEKGCSKLRQLVRFWKFCWKLAPRVDTVFVHMNAVYVPLGWLFWKLHHKKIFLWRNHPRGGLLTRIAYVLADKIFYTSPHAHASRYARSQQMPAGIDTEFFHRDPRVARKPNSILCLGRISPIKHIEVLIEAAYLLHKKNIPFTVSIVGSPANPEDHVYAERLRKQARELVAQGVVRFSPGVTQQEALRLYNSHEIFMNTTPVGSYDKTVLEAMACEMLVATSNASFEDILPKECLSAEENAQNLAEKIGLLLCKTPDEKKRLTEECRRRVVERHSLAELAGRITSAY